MSTPSSTSGGQAHEPGPSTDVEAEVAFLRAAVRDMRAQGHVISGSQYQAALRAARATATVEVQGVGQVSTAAGSQPINDHAPLARLARRGEHGFQLAQELQTPVPPGMVSGPAAREAIRMQAARMLQQQADRDLQIAAQVQAQQQRALAASGAFEAHLGEDRVAQHHQQLEAEAAAWRASVANAQAEGTRRADAEAQAAIQRSYKA